MTSVRYLNTILTVLAVVVTLQLWTVWSTGPHTLAEARAQGIPDGGAQREQILDQLKLLNRKVDQFKALLTSGKVRVSIADAQDEPTDEAER
jgi:hypothetical protein